MKKLVYLALLVLGVGVFFSLGRDYELRAQVPSEVTTPEEAECIGEALADYMNAVIDGAGDLNNIKLASPVFNMTNHIGAAIYDSMDSNGANWGGLDGYAGNTYTTSGDTAWGWYDSLWRGRFSGKDTLLTEFGDLRIMPGYSISVGRSESLEHMRDQYRQLTSEGDIISVNYFSAFGSNSSFDWANLSDGEIRTMMTDVNAGEGGVNSASPIDGGHHAGAVARVGLHWAVEILYAPDNLSAAATTANNAIGQGVTPIFRLCVEEACGFEDPADLVEFLIALNDLVNGEVWVIAGPNEPQSEHWAAADCTDDVVTEPPPINIVPPIDYEPEYVKCNEMSDEFHSLRPYPASSCEDVPGETVMLCGNNIVMQDSFAVTPNDAVSCAGSTCNFEVNVEKDLIVDLSNTDFPIVGNTELTPNSVRQDNYIPGAHRMNEFVSWYLNGVIQRAEEQFFQASDPEGLFAIVNFSGPIRKLLPRHIQSENDPGSLRMKQINDAYQTMANYPEIKIRHNQIVVCVGPVECYPGGSPLRLSIGPDGNIPAVPNNPNSPLFPYIPFTSTEDKRGEALSGDGGGFSEVVSGDLTVRSRLTPPPPASGDESVTLNITTVTGRSESLSSEENDLIFPHAEEVPQLSEALQTSYLPYGYEGDEEPVPGSVNPSPPPEPGCVILDTIRNPGDRIYGDMRFHGTEDEPDPDIVKLGLLEYSAEFSCDFIEEEEEIVIDEECFETTECPAYITDNDDYTSSQKTLYCTNYKRDQCSTTTGGGVSGSCAQEIELEFPVELEIPGVEPLWLRLVAGSTSVFRRIFPKFGLETPIDALDDIPTETVASYGKQNEVKQPVGINLNPSEILANNLPGAQARLYFPHLGSVHEYFLRGIQKALRPQGFAQLSGSGFIIGEEPPDDVAIDDYPSIECPNNIPPLVDSASGIICSTEDFCNATAADVPSAYLGVFRDNVIRIGEGWIETGGENSNVDNCYYEVVKRSLDAGVNPVYSLAIWIQESGASNYNSNVTICDLEDGVNTVKDFGIADYEIAGNFDAQINRFLRLPYLYPNTFGQCYEDRCNVGNFSLVYQQGVPAGECRINSAAASYANKTIRTMTAINGSCQPRYPTDMSCQP